MNPKIRAARLLPVIPFVAGALLAVSGAAPASAANPPATLMPGEVVKLSGTDDLWVADSQGQAHFASDPQVLSGKPVNWGAEIEVTPDQLASMQRGDPWLSTDLVRIGSAIYLPAPGAGASTTPPVLFHIQSPNDLWLLGVTSANYGQLVLDQQSWEQRYGRSLNGFVVAGDVQLTPAPAAAATAAASVDEASPDAASAADAAAPTLSVADDTTSS